MPQQPWLGAGLDGASSTCHPVAEALCSGCTRSRAAFFPEKPGLVLPETCSARTGCRYSTGGELCVCVCVCVCVVIYTSRKIYHFNSC